MKNFGYLVEMVPKWQFSAVLQQNAPKIAENSVRLCRQSFSFSFMSMIKYNDGPKEFPHQPLVHMPFYNKNR